MQLQQRIARGFRKLTMAELTEHRVDDADIEWFAGCKLNHTAAFPYLAYDAVRTVLVLMVYQVFLPLVVTASLAAMGLAIIARQYVIERRMRLRTHTNVQNYEAMRDLILIRAVLWGGVTALGLSNAPSEFLVGLVPVALCVMVVDGLCMIAMPKRAVLAVAIHASAIAIPLLMMAEGPARIGAFAAIAGFVFLHWALFNLHYIFATRRLRTRHLSEANDTIQLLLNQYDEDGSDWLIECDEEGAILRPNRRFCAAADRTAEELTGLRLSLLFNDSPEREELRAIGVREEPFRNLILPLEVDGVERWWSISARPVYERDGSLACWRGFIADVTRTRQAEAKVNYMAHYDVLTGLPNRSVFGTTMSRAFDRREDAKLLAVLFVDLDHFKAVNDNYGHAVGDAVLGEAARRIESAVDSSAMVARLGGDEFAVLLDRIEDRTTAQRSAEAIVSAMDAPFVINGQELSISASVGVAFAPDNGVSGEEVLRAADLALYDAKARGRQGASLFDPAMQDQVEDRRKLEIDMRSALKRGEMELFYQPMRSAADSRITGYEALLRWHHPQRGLLAPDAFIPVAEDTGQIVPIGAWILREALAQAASWPADLSISVNLSPAQIRDQGLINTIVGALAANEVAPQRLEIEITEALLIQSEGEDLAALHRLRDLGIRIVLDDFGAGRSSLNYMRQFPFDRIKIDECFAAGDTQTSESEAIIEAVINLAAKLDITTTAEGIETAEQLRRLQNRGCHQVQGFLLGEALPASEIIHTREPAMRKAG